MTWYKHWFNHPLYLELYAHRDRREAIQAVQLFFASTGVSAGATALDLGCGPGRHSLELARRGVHAVAADLSPLLLGIARHAAEAEGISLPFVRADMKRLPFAGAFDAVLQLFTAFGYFRTDRENAHVVAEVARATRPGGWYFLDFLNAPFVERTLEPRTESVAGGRTVVQHREIRAGRVEKSITVLTGGGEEAHFSESVRMYTPDELAALFRAGGFRVEHAFGDYRGNPLNPNSPRCILVGKRDEDT